MELFSLLVSLVAELAKLARVLLADGMRFLALLARSHSGLNSNSPETGLQGHLDVFKLECI